MSTNTPRLQLKRNDGSDPFKRQDFTDNWNKIDAAPGLHVCTSGSRPTWGAAQAGRTILETDTRTTWEWSGTAWLPILSATSGWQLSITPQAWVNKSTAVTYSFGTITTTRPGTLLVDVSATIACLDTSNQTLVAQVFINNVNASNTGSAGFNQYTGSNNNGSTNSFDTAWAKGFRAVAPGTHTIQVRFTVGAGILPIHIYRAGANVVLINEQSR